jgi:hypothetical protein
VNAGLSKEFLVSITFYLAELNLDNLDKLSFEKVQNMIFKNILGVHGKASNIAVHTE